MPDEADDIAALLAAALADPDAAAADRLAGRLRADPALVRHQAGLVAVDQLLRWRACRIADAAFARSVALRLRARGDSTRFTKAVVTRLPRPRARRWPWAIAAAVLAGLGLYALMDREPLQARLADGSLVALGGELAPAAPLVVELSDGSRIALEAAAHWRWEGSGGGRLLAGGAHVLVVPQPAGRDFAIALPHVRVRALGTAFSLAVHEVGWSLHVDDGVVGVAEDAGGEQRVHAGTSLRGLTEGWWTGVPLLGPGMTGWLTAKGPGQLGLRELPATGPHPWSLELALPAQPMDAPTDGWWATVERAWMAPSAPYAIGLAVRQESQAELHWGVQLRERDGDVWLAFSSPLQQGALREITWRSEEAPLKLLAQRGDGRFDPAAVQGIGLTAAGTPGSIRIERLVAWAR